MLQGFTPLAQVAVMLGIALLIAALTAAIIGLAEFVGRITEVTD